MLNSRTGKPLIGVLGFYGRGNSGDEAILCGIYESFRDEFDVVVVVDEHGAYRGFDGWYPYNEIERVHVGNIHYFAKRMAGLIVGGGGLGIGYGGSQALVCKFGGTPVVLAGTDHVHITKNLPGYRSRAAALYLSIFDRVFLRSAPSVAAAQADGREVNYGADWALRLVAPRPKERSSTALITLREWPMDIVQPDYYVAEIRRLVDTVRQAGLQPVFLPLAPEDELFLEKLGIAGMLPSRSLWSDTSKMVAEVAASAMVVSVGRLHAMVFAIANNTPTVQVIPPLEPDLKVGRFGKMRYMAEEFAIPFVSCEEAARLIESGDVTVSDETKKRHEEAQRRLSQMVADIKNLFRERTREWEDYRARRIDDYPYP
ncbi:polysaccharide pyruvyl transferase family protein [Chelativorans sp. Marseille-P2723]|uniref:polysaccharide pyruvyl transferase family protein n=1 Tax=Chelativorans sp. Marseille-P2723 TaxID=2709133 RepID=UPI00157151E8|nr:polysaccharide pyruvyl transferase family protein [Chelativorans sp. Marseille-P2723]